MKKLISVVLFAILLLSVSACGSGPQPSGGRHMAGDETTEAVALPTEPPEEPAPATALGDATSDGYSLFLDEGTFGKSAQVTVVPADGALLEAFNNSGFELTGTPLSIGSSQYEGEFFATDVTLTLPATTDPAELSSYVFVYYDENTKEFRTFFPDSYDLEKGTATISLPHFSGWSTAYIKDEQKIDKFLESYCTKQAIADSESKQNAMALEPYIRLKAEALKLNQQATEDLIQSTINVLGGRFTGKYKDTIETGTKAVTAVVRGVYDGDPDAAATGLDDAVNGAIMHAWSDLKYTERIDKMAGGEFAGSAAGTAVASATGIYRMNEKLKSGDADGALMELSGIMQNVHPAVEITTKAANYLGTRVNLEFTNWKAGKVEELYQWFKNGGTDFWGNTVQAGDPETFLEFLNYPHGLTFSSGIQRFYNMDKFPEICEKYGWEFKKYEDMPEEYRKRFEKLAEDGLMEYFKTRMAQEKAAQELIESEHDVINTLLNSGALDSSLYKEYFGETDGKGYNIEERLNRLVTVRETVLQYVDEDALARARKDGGENIGDVMTSWVSFVSKYEKGEAIDHFLKDMKDRGLLKKEFYDMLVKTPSLREVEGTYSNGSITITDVFVPDAIKEAMTAAAEDDEEGCEIDPSEFVGQTHDFPFEIQVTSTEEGVFISLDDEDPFTTPEMVYDLRSGQFSPAEFQMQGEGETWNVTISLTCEYTNDEMTSVKITGVLTETATGEYAGVKITCSLTGSKTLQ